MKKIREAMSCEKGFTLVELLVVIGIIGILAMMLLPQFGGMRDRARIASCQSNLKNIGTQLEAFYADLERYPNNNEWAAQFATLGIAVCTHDAQAFEYIPGAVLTDPGNGAIFDLSTDMADPGLEDDATGRIDTYLVYCPFHDGSGTTDDAKPVAHDAAKTQLLVTQEGVERRPE